MAQEGGLSRMTAETALTDEPPVTPIPPPGKRILIADDHPLVRTGMTTLLSGEADLEVCAETGSIPETLRQVEASRPDLVILDLSFPEGDAFDLIKRIRARWPEVKVLVCSMHEESLYAERVLKAGAQGYICKQEANTNIISAARRVLEGGVYLSEAMRLRLEQRGTAGDEPPSALEALTDRELQVFGLIGNGRSTGQIADQLHLSVKTIETHRDKIKRKLGLGSAIELTRSAVQWVLQRRLDDNRD